MNVIEIDQELFDSVESKDDNNRVIPEYLSRIVMSSPKKTIATYP